MGIFGWCYQEDPKALVGFVDEIAGQVPFYGNKVLCEDNEASTAWYNAYKNLFDAVGNFLKENCNEVLNWSGSEDGAGAAAFFASDESAAVSSSSAPVQA